MGNKYSLHFGINSIDKSVYKGQYRDLKNAENDARTYFSIAQNQGFNSEIFTGPQVISNTLVGKLESLAGKMNRGDLLFLTYSGHGTKAKDLNGDEVDKKDEILVLYDRLFIDDEFPICWNRFQPGVKIFFVNDSCFNGTVSRFMARKLGQQLHRGIEEASADPDFQRNLDFYRSIPKPLAPAACSVIHMGSCQDNQLASDGYPGASNGVFTGKFLQLYDRGNYNDSYMVFFSELKSAMPITQVPTWDTGAGENDPGFENSKLFN